MLNLDTHIVIDGLTGNLSPSEREMLDGTPVALSDIVLWEIAKLAQFGRIELTVTDPAFRRFLRGATLIPISVEIAWQSAALDFRSDPADEIIAATSIVERIPLLTRDRKILKSKMVPFASKAMKFK